MRMICSTSLPFQPTLPHRERHQFSISVHIDRFISTHAPAQGATTSRMAMITAQLFQPTLPHRERRKDPTRYHEGECISTHAPAQGATGASTSQETTYVLFQPTLPHRERPAIPFPHGFPFYFNPRSRTGSDTLFALTSFNSAISIHAPAQGATSPALDGIIPGAISIHAPAQGATGHRVVFPPPVGFQSTLPHRERRRSGFSRAALTRDFNPRSRTGSDGPTTPQTAGAGDFNPRSRTGSDRRLRTSPTKSLSISIHAPAQGATSPACSTPRKPEFQSTLPHRERHLTSLRSDVDKIFQSTLPHRERLFATWAIEDAQVFQSTLPHRERPNSDFATGMENVFQSTLPHRERHLAQVKASPDRNFNPRSRTGSDGGCEIAAELAEEFQSTLPHRERPPSLLADSLSPEFQSTLPHRERRTESSLRECFE